jgi:polyphosphate kinase
MAAVIVEPAVAVLPAPVLTPLLNREQAILEFNRRVLAQALRPDVPLLERLRYITIVSSNLDEFFEVRFADYLEASRLPGSGITTREMAEVAAAAHELVDEQYRCLQRGGHAALKHEGVLILNHAERDEGAACLGRQLLPEAGAARCWCRSGLDPAHPFPQVANKSLNLHRQARLGAMPSGRDNSIAIVKVPRVLPRVIRLPAELTPGVQGFVLLSSVIRAHLAELFPGRLGRGLLAVPRHA